MHKVSTRTIMLASDTAECERLAGFVGRYLQDNSITQPELMSDLRLIIEETLTNIIHHGYHDANDREIEVTLSLRDNSLSLSFSDSAPAFDPMPMEMNSTDDHCNGGMGIQLVKALTDRQQYRRDNGRNVFTVTKKLY